MIRRLIKCKKCGKERKVYGNRIKCCKVLQDITEDMIVMVSAKRDKIKIETLEKSSEKTLENKGVFSDRKSIIIKTKNNIKIKESENNGESKPIERGIPATYGEQKEESIKATTV